MMIMRRKPNIKVNIYKIVNQVNGKVYIGQTYRSIYTRYMEHMIDPESGVYADVCKFGRSCFTYELLHTCISEYADQWEHYYICKFDATNPEYGYNRVSGATYSWETGGFNPSKTVEGKARIAAYNKAHMEQITRGMKAYNNSRKLPVGMVDENGIIIRVFDCLNDACRYLGKQSSYTTRIKGVCDKFKKNGQPYRMCGYAWTMLLNKNVQTNSDVECKAEDELPLE